MPLPAVALSSSFIMKTRLDSPAILNASIIIPGFALEYILELPVSCSASLIELMSRVVHGSLRILAIRYAICDLPVPAGPTRRIPYAGRVCVRLIWIIVSIMRCFTLSIPNNSSSSIRLASTGSIDSK